MKLITKIVAWINILPGILMVIFAILVAVFGSAIMTGIANLNPQPPALVKAIFGLGAIAFASVIIGFVLLCIFPWIYLLKKRAWAWWFLTILWLIACIVSVLTGGLEVAEGVTPSDKGKAIADTIACGFIPGLTLLVLLMDRPSGWKSSRTGKRRRKARRSSSTSYRRRRR